MDPPDPGPRLLRGGESRLEVVRQRRGPSRRRAGDGGPHPRHRHARRAGSRVPPAAGRATCGVRAASLPRLVGRRDRREPSRPDRDDQVEAALRDFHTPGGARRRCPDDRLSVSGADGMNENEFARTARAWLDDGPTRMSDRAVLSALEEIHTTQQRRVFWPARRATPVNIYARAAIAAVLVVGVGLGAISLLPLGGGSGVGGPPSPSPTPSLAPSPTPSLAS